MYKRARHSPPESVEEGSIAAEKKESSAAASSFRNVSACNRCRLRKNRCDQRLPSCASCEKAGVRCVGYDPITKREIPRRFVPDLISIVGREGVCADRMIVMSSTSKQEWATSSLSSATTTSLSPPPKSSNMPPALAQTQISYRHPATMA